MTNTIIQVQDSIENLKSNLDLIHCKAQKLEQCLQGILIFVRYGVDVELFEPLINHVQDLAESIDNETDFAAGQYGRLHSHNNIEHLKVTL